jgi:hypothetical protein
MTTTTTTTISGVSLMTRQGVRAPEVFEIVLSTGGIDFRRPKRPSAKLTWDRVSDWQIEEREADDDIVLTLQGDGAATPLLIPGWSAADLGALLSRLSGQQVAPPTRDQVRAAGRPDAGAGSPGAQSPGVVELLGTAAKPGGDDENGAVATRGRASLGLVPWKTVVTIVLLGVLATAVTIVLLQSAGIINWNILGPTS